MLVRKIDNFLLEWKKEKNHKPFLAKGARQIEKTTSIREFGKLYESFVENNFKLDPQYKECFVDYSVNNILKISGLLNREANFLENHTLVFLDEIQEYYDAITSFKSFCEDGKYDVIASGALLVGSNFKT